MVTPRERFDRLPQQQRDAILDKHRLWNVEYIDWWDSVYDSFKTDMEDIGIEVDKMYFSGFWSQGDGACFEGCVRDWALFLPTLGHSEPALITLAADYWRLTVTHQGHYYHENCTSFNYDMDNPRGWDEEEFIEARCPYMDDSIQAAVWYTLLNQIDFDSLEKAMIDAFKDHMRDLYKQLNAEYDYLTSDEAILDSLEVNDRIEEAITQITEEHEDA